MDSGPKAKEGEKTMKAQKMMKQWLAMSAAFCAMALTAAALTIPNLFPFLDPSGAVSTLSTQGSFNTSGPFFQSLGTNGRTCASCHVVSNAMGLSAAHAEEVFKSSRGKDPLFSAVDGAVCPTAPRGGQLDFSLLREKGLLRIGLTLAAKPQFEITAVEDPYGCALTKDGKGDVTVSVYRRPLPATNLGFLTSVMFDGRETIDPLNDKSTYAANLFADLSQQAIDATEGHAQATHAPTDAQVKKIVEFEEALNSAQALDFHAGLLNTDGAKGGAEFLSKTPFFPGINDVLGTQFNPQAFTLYSKWEFSGNVDRRSIEIGEQIFNTHPMVITNVRGLNDTLNQPEIAGTCTTCHDTPNVGDHSVALPLEIGTSRTVKFETDPTIRAAVNELSMPKMPVYRVVCTEGPLSGEVTYTSDPGKAILSGNCSDVGRGKGLVLRGLAARAPYFHNGAAATLDEVVKFYDKRFQMHLTHEQEVDLVAFLKTL